MGGGRLAMLESASGVFRERRPYFPDVLAECGPLQF